MLQRPGGKVHVVDRIWRPKRKICLELPRSHKIDRDAWPIAAIERGRPLTIGRSDRSYRTAGARQDVMHRSRIVGSRGHAVMLP
jgi:hypothetical protein